jgi:hypothetical protein
VKIALDCFVKMNENTECTAKSAKYCNVVVGQFCNYIILKSRTMQVNASAVLIIVMDMLGTSTGPVIEPSLHSIWL